MEKAPPDVPRLTHAGAVKPDILGIVVEAGHVEPSRLIPYEKQPGDSIIVNKKLPNGDIKEAVLQRNGEIVGWISGENNDYLCTVERFNGVVLNTDAAGSREAYILRSDDDDNYAPEKNLKPLKVSRKSKPVNWTLPDKAASPMRHYMYLHLPFPLKPGATYTLDLVPLALHRDDTTFVFDPLTLRSEAVHVNHLGFRPDDPGKCAYLSVWLGSGGAVSWKDKTEFHLVDSASGKRVYSGTVTLSFGAEDDEGYKRGENLNYTDVCRMDFGEFSTPGTYRVVVEGIGCSYPFEIGTGTWQRAFLCSMKGFLNQRSGLELGPPYTEYRRPRNFHPDDGVEICQSTFKAGDGRLQELVAACTDEKVNAWGGYHDAGDWDRRIMHLSCSRLHLELLEMAPDVLAKVKHTMPESDNELPDLLDEALWNIGLYRRLQRPDGSVPYGIESSAHPRAGEVSWMESLRMAAFAPDVRSTYIYAGVAARAALALRKYGADTKAKEHESSALRAMEWAENQSKVEIGKQRDRRNLAAAELYRLTGDDRWHKVFMRTTALKNPVEGVRENGEYSQGHAAFIYARLPETMVDSGLQACCREAILITADRAVEYQKHNAFDLAYPNPEMPQILGFFSTPHLTEVAWAHYLTGADEYLQCMVQACGFGLGANPMNMTLTTGLGHAYPRHPLHIDSRRTGQPAPEGITVYGNSDFVWELEKKGARGWLTWPFKYFFTWQCFPGGYEWPPTETYFDVYGVASMNEFTVQQNLGPASFAWGYLAARKPRSSGKAERGKAVAQEPAAAAP